ncbi:ABC transporter substrate-binding protein [Paenibacillus campi]|uniref:ABC transporter substrate-binding protein n=1 Tax=Paenibacillus campi TaxID=3106031 RepID=UPI002AFF5748|nr:extracellular solute-binding protein [Paenibacillus sp. SGZ-1014]
MKKRWLTPLLLLTVLALVVAGCGNDNDSHLSASGKKVIQIYQGKVEIADALARLKVEYEKQHPDVELQIQSVGGGADYAASLKAKFAAGDVPDIFTNGGDEEMNLWLEYLEDLSDQPWVNDLVDGAAAQISKDGHIYGQPNGLEGFGFIYNKDIFAKVGITQVPTTIDELRAVCEKLKAAGYTPFSNGFQEWWVLGNHNVTIPFSHQPDPDKFIQELDNGTAQIPGNEKFNEWLNLLDLMVKYGNPNPLTTDYNTQVTLFADGKAAMMQQGNWTQVQIDGIKPNMNIGLMPMPINDNKEENDRVFVRVPNNWVIYKDSPVKKEAKQFLNWLVTSDTGRHYITDEFKFVPAFKSIKTTDKQLGPIGADIVRYNEAGKTLPWIFPKFPMGLSKDYASTMQAYLAGELTRAEMLQQMQEQWVNLQLR